MLRREQATKPRTEEMDWCQKDQLNSADFLMRLNKDFNVRVESLFKYKLHIHDNILNSIFNSFTSCFKNLWVKTMHFFFKKKYILSFLTINLAQSIDLFHIKSVVIKLSEFGSKFISQLLQIFQINYYGMNEEWHLN